MAQTENQSVMPQALSIIGAGRVATALGRVFGAAHAVQVRDVLARDRTKAEAALAFIGAGRAVEGFTNLRPADLFLLAVPDDQIAPCCRLLAASGVILPGTVVFHCSGALDASALSAARAVGAAVASVHPIRSFGDPAAVAAGFAGTFCGIEGDDAALAVLHPLFDSAGARLVAIDPANKTLYHAAAVFASNYLVTLIDAAVRNYARAGIAQAEALQMIAPLLRETADNVFRLGPAAALTGPIARGDRATVTRQHAALAACDGADAALYSQLAIATETLAASRSR